jgi:PQQ-dependent dehydrogenase (methanol/ethanol family)
MRTGGKGSAAWSLAGLAAALSGLVCSGYAYAQSLTEWSHIGGNPEHWGYSAATQINAATVSRMGLLWYVDLPVPDGLVGNPLVRGGVVYQGAPRGIVLANDVASGRLLWKFEPQLDLSQTSLTGFYGVNKNRGIGLDEHNVYITSGDCHVYAVDRTTGRQIWKVLSCDPTQDYGIIAAPRTGGGEVFVGNNNHELGSVRGFEDAFDARTGKHLWRFYTVPGDPSKPFENKAMEMASKTWGKDSWRYTHGGANPWDGAVYDAETGLLIFGAGNPDLGHYEKGWMNLGPGDADMRAQESKDAGKREALATGDWLFSSTILAVNARTGEYVWHLQLVPHDRFESDAAAGFIIADLPIHGRKRHVVMQAAKDGYFYVLDVRTGECISAQNYVPIETFEPIDPKTCRLTPKEESKYWLHPDRQVILQPGGYGSHGWERAAYNPNTGLVYIPAFIYAERVGGPAHYDHEYGFRKGDKYQAGGRLIAWDPIAQTERWHVDYPIVQNGGVLTTAGNLVLQGTPSGKFLAYSADSGKLLWSYDTGSVILGEPAAVMSDGKEIILVPAGDGGASVSETDTPRIASTTRTLARSRLLAFALGGTASLPGTPPKVVNKPSRPPQPAALAARGASIYASNSCELCHGPETINGGGHIPDLRNMPEDMLEAMPAILQKGALRQEGMPQFPYFSDDEVNALQAYVINQAWAGYNAQQEHRSNAP